MAKTHDQNLMFERKILEQKLEVARQSYQLSESTVRLPKHNITKFNGKSHDWLRFSGSVYCNG